MASSLAVAQLSGRTSGKAVGVVLLLTLALAYLPSPALSSWSVLHDSNEATSARMAGATTTTFDPSKPITFAWLFGYLGKHFIPTNQLNLTREDLIETASTLSTQLAGHSNLALVTAVAEPGPIPSSLYPAVTSYVASLHQYAPLVIGRLDLNRYNVTSSPTVYDELAKYVTTFNLDGVLFDHAIIYYSSVGQGAFNDMMEKMHDLYPNVYFILNDARAAPLLPTAGTTWANQTYISPSVSLNSYDAVNYDAIVNLNQVWNGRVLLHLDAYAKVPGEPMGVFADQSNETEISAVQDLVNNGTIYNYRFLYPIVGGWTFVNSTYGGTLYNSLSKGNYARGTFPSFMQTMQGTSKLTVTSETTTGTVITGFWTELHDQTGTVLASGYTPFTYPLNNGQTYIVEVDGYGSCAFDRWLDTGNTNNQRNVSVTSDTSLTAVLNCST